MRFPRQLAVLIVFFALCFAALAKDREFTLPRAFHPKTYPAHEAHENEKVAIAADPYDMPDKAAPVFTVDYKKEGLLPIHLIISNDAGEAVSLADMKVLLITNKRVKISPADIDDIYRRISHQTRRGDEQTIRNPLPIPLPKKKPRSISKEAEMEVEAAQFLAKAVEPHSIKSGFLFFDVEGIENPLAGARLVVTGLADGKGNELFYFEIPLAKYLGYEPLKPQP